MLLIIKALHEEKSSVSLGGDLRQNGLCDLGSRQKASISGVSYSFYVTINNKDFYSIPDSNGHLLPPISGAKIAYFFRKSDLRDESKISGAKVNFFFF